MNGLTATIDRQEGRNYVLIFTDQQELVVPIHYFPKTVRLGEIVELKIFTEATAKKDQAELARYLLEEILNGR